jgi:PD-(D/E)XK nuclease superfamily
VNQQAIPVVYGTIRLDIGFRADLIVENQVIVKIKSVESLAPVHRKQLLTYLRLADRRLSLLINSSTALIKDAIIHRHRTGRRASRKAARTPRTPVKLQYPIQSPRTGVLRPVSASGARLLSRQILRIGVGRQEKSPTPKIRDLSQSFENTIFKSLIPGRQPSDWLAN